MPYVELIPDYREGGYILRTGVYSLDRKIINLNGGESECGYGKKKRLLLNQLKRVSESCAMTPICQ